MHRDLVPGSISVYPLKGFGAVEFGAHRVCDPHDKPQCDTTDEVASYVMLWQQTGDRWIITRVISYDHHAPRAP
ncbi:MAG: hypothetical protein ABI742_09785 [Gemmatimonadota bacterium]